jgi:alpha-mannosidase
LISAGDDAIPRGTWQIDPFGHSNTEAWLLGSEAGFESLYWGRTDYQDVALRTSNAGKDNNQWLEWVWRGSESLGPAADIFAGELTTGQYAAPIDFNDG